MQKIKKILNTDSRGITLVALVISIIIMIILLAVSIRLLIKAGIISTANDAKNKYINSATSEEELVNKAEDEINSIVGNNKEEDNPPIVKDETPPVIHELKWDRTAGVLNVNAEDAESGIDEYLYFIDNSDTPNVKKDGNINIQISSGTNGGNYQNPYIPKGFWYKEGDVENGYVITDAPNVKVQVKDKEGNIGEAHLQGNEFVWVPVDNVNIKFERKAWKVGSMQDISSKFIETQDTALQTSVSTYGGFYIARYEAGDGFATSKRAGSTGTTNPAVSKKGAFVYNYVTKAQAEQIAKNMYSKSVDGITSRLISSYAWDTTLSWLEKKSYSMVDSRSWGNYNNAAGAATQNSGASNMNYTTGRSDAWKARNIYDLAGNVHEWTTERYSNDRFPTVYRGGAYSMSGTGYAAAYRSSYVTSTYSMSDVGFRCIIYK